MEMYILNEDGSFSKTESIEEWGRNLDKTKRIAKNTIDNIVVSTVFLGINHSYDGHEPILFETMIFRGEHDHYQKRYVSKQDALAGHEIAVNLVMESLNKQKDG